MTDQPPNGIGRRSLGALAVGVVASPSLSPSGQTERAVFYVAVGPELFLYDVDEAELTLSENAVIRVPEAIQYIWVHPTKKLLYAAYSNRFSTKLDNNHGVAVYTIDRQTGALSARGEPTRLKDRPINITLDPAGEHLLVAYNMPSTLTVHQLAADGTAGAAIPQREPIDGGIYAHQVRVAPSGRFVVLPTRGNDATATTKEDPGAIKVFRFDGSQLTHEVSVTNGNGLGFGPRHVDFHPTGPWMYVSMERNNQVLTYGLQEDGITAAPLFTASTVNGGGGQLPVQFVGPIHVHPSGKFVYLANRSDGVVDIGGHKVHGAGENSVAAFAIDPSTGEPRLFQTIDTQTFHCRTFSIHPGGRMLVTAAVGPLDVQDGNAVRTVTAGLTVFGIGEHGALKFARKYDVNVGNEAMFWCGMVAL